VSINKQLRTFLAIGACVLAMGDQAFADSEPVPPQRPPFFELPVPPPVTELSGLRVAMPAGRARYLPLLVAEAKARGVPPEVADAVARVESAYDSAARGSSGERGMMQVMPPTAAMLGFKGTLDQLAEPETNIRLGVTYLAGAWRLAGGDLCRALMKYRAGHHEERMSALSVEYCRRAKSHLAALGSPLGAGALPASSLGAVSTSSAADPPSEYRRFGGRLFKLSPTRTPELARQFWAAHKARVRAIEARLLWKRGRVSSGG
jgi:hypothetical protein